MKGLIFLTAILLSHSVLSNEVLKSRVKAIKYKRLAMVECGYNEPNMEIFFKKLIAEKDTAKLACLESKASVTKAKMDAMKAKINAEKALILWFKNLDCSTLNDTFKENVCKIIKKKAL